MMFHVDSAGEYWLEVNREAPHLLRRGSLVAVPQGNGQRVRSRPTDRAVPLFDIPVERVSDRYEITRHDGDGEFTQLTCGVVRFDHLAGHLPLSLPPRVLKIDALDAAAGNWLQSTLHFIARWYISGPTAFDDRR